MKVCIIGGGPSGLYVSKYLASHVKHISIYEKSSLPGGNYKYSNTANMNFCNILNKSNIKFYNNTEINDKNFSEIEKKYDVFVLATGGMPKKADNENIITGMDILSHKVDVNKLGTKICIIGMGNVALQLASFLLNTVTHIDMISRRTLSNTPFSAVEIRNLLSPGNVKLNILHEDINGCEERKVNIIKNSLKTKCLDNTKYVKLIFNTEVESVIKDCNQYVVKYNDGNIDKYDSVISSFGFEPRSMKLNTRKPVFESGWCVDSRGDLSTAMQSAKKVAQKILNIWNNRQITKS